MTFNDDIGMSELAAIRAAELCEAEQHCTSSFEAYWAGSASASVIRDYAGGRVTTHVAGTHSRRPAR